MKIIFTTHSLTRMRERNVAKQDIIQAIKQPDIQQRESENVEIFRKENLEVVGEIKKNKIIIITLYWL